MISKDFEILGQSRLRAARPSRIVGQGYSQASTSWCVLNVSLRVSGAQLGLDIVDQLWKQFGWYRGALLCIRVDTYWENRYVMCGSVYNQLYSK